MSLLMFEKELEHLGNNIRQLRRIRNLSQETLSELCGLHRTYICDVERGMRNVTVGSLLRLANGLQTSVSELTTGLEPRISEALTVTHNAEAYATNARNAFPN